MCFPVNVTKLLMQPINKTPPDNCYLLLMLDCNSTKNRLNRKLSEISKGEEWGILRKAQYWKEIELFVHVLLTIFHLLMVHQEYLKTYGSFYLYQENFKFTLSYS